MVVCGGLGGAGVHAGLDGLGRGDAAPTRAAAARAESGILQGEDAIVPRREFVIALVVVALLVEFGPDMLGRMLGL